MPCLQFQITDCLEIAAVWIQNSVAVCVRQCPCKGHFRVWHCLPCKYDPVIFIQFSSAVATVDLSRMTASLSSSCSSYSSTSNVVSGHVSSTWFIVCCWPQSQVRHHLCTFAWHGPWAVWKRLRLFPFPLLDNIRVMVIVWRLRGNIIRTALCWIVWHNVHSPWHTYISSSYVSNRLGLSHWELGPLCCA